MPAAAVLAFPPPPELLVVSAAFTAPAVFCVVREVGAAWVTLVFSLLPASKFWTRVSSCESLPLAVPLSIMGALPVVDEPPPPPLPLLLPLPLPPAVPARR